MDKYNELKTLVDELKPDFEKFYSKKNQAAGVRVRQGMQKIKTLAQEIRVEIQSKKKQA